MMSGYMKAIGHNPFTIGKDTVEIVIYAIGRDWARLGDSSGDLTSLIISESDS